MRPRTCLVTTACLVLLPLAGGAQSVEVAGFARWVDPGDGAHPARRARVEVLDADRGVLLDTARTDESGAYRVFLAAPDVRAVYVIVFSRTPHAEVVHPAVLRPHGIRSGERLLPPEGLLVMDPIVGMRDSASNQAIALADALEHGADFRSRRAGAAPPPVTVSFPSDSAVPYFDGTRLHVPPHSAWAWDVVLHEYGHFVGRLDALTTDEGGPHALDRNVPGTKDHATRLAWAEGWATYFSIAVQLEARLADLRMPTVGDTAYTSPGFGSVNLNRLAPDWSHGERSEVSVMRVLYNLADDDPGASFSEHAALGPQRLWDLLRAGRPETLSQGWGLVARGLSDDEAAAGGNTLEVNRVAPAPYAPAEGAPLTDAAPSFEWFERGSSLFRLVVTSAAGTVFYSESNIPNSWHQPSDTAWARVRAAAAGRAVYWYVEGTDPSQPATGPYRSARRRLGP